MVLNPEIKAMLPLRVQSEPFGEGEDPNYVFLTAGKHNPHVDFIRVVKQMQGHTDGQFMPFIEYMVDAVNTNHDLLKKIQRLESLLAECWTRMDAIQSPEQARARFEYINNLSKLRYGD